MRKHRFFTSQELHIHTNVQLDEETSHYIMRVLRLKVADELYLFNNSGAEFLSTISSLTKHNVIVTIAAEFKQSVESPLQIHLGQVLGKGDKMDFVIQKATELGVNSITPLYSEHTVIKNIADRTAHKIEHWHKIAASASAQSGRNLVPAIHEPALFNAWISTVASAHKLILHPSATAHSIKATHLQNVVTIVIGPEGGFSGAEIILAQQNNFVPISLGPRILRTETAGLATIAILQALYGDL